MTLIQTSFNRRSFLKTSALAGGGILISFSWLAGCQPAVNEELLTLPEEWYSLNGFLKIGENGVVTIYCPNPEFGQGVKTSMPMIVAEELDIDWKKVIVEQAPFNTEIYKRQLSGGSQSIRQGWSSLRMAGASARQMLKEAAAQAWGVPVEEITTEEGMLFHKPTEKTAGYGEMASAAANIEVPKEVALKDVKDFKIVGTSRKNVNGKDIVTGKPMFSMDYNKEGMLIAMIVHPPAFGKKFKSFDDAAVKSMPGIKDVFTIKLYNDSYEKSMFDTATFTELVAIVGNSTWEVMNAKKAINVEWEDFDSYKETWGGFGGTRQVDVPSGLESSEDHYKEMESYSNTSAKVARKDGNPEEAFKNAAKIIERTYSAPFLAHNTMEPMNCFAEVTDDHAQLAGPLQAPEFLENTLSARLGMPLDKIDIEMTRMGGGFGRRAYSHYMIEAALISQKAKAPVKLMYTREDDMTYGIYRPTYHAKYRAAFDENNNLTAFHVNAGGIPESPLHANRFPAGAIDNYLAEQWAIDSNITIGAFRAPRSNFIAGAEQSFLDEIAEELGKDPIDFRLELLERAISNPVGERNDYDAARYAGVLELVKEKSGWNKETDANIHRGVSAYFCHNSYAAHVLEVKFTNGKLEIPKVTTAIDCGIVVNPDAAANMAQGAVVDGIGNALFGQLSLKNGKPDQNNFDRYKMIRFSEAPKEIDVHFVKNEIDPTGMGEPPFPPVFGAVANALYKATGKRHLNQPFFPDIEVLG